ncbi:hypothetical protein PR048_022915 [Dryococelus australis]|uniref:Uncharacterized protein n=1 Tax=Dryococelus australis TaxID=614101 RepID=A0ABQ9GSP2_9NEOP|nr:hypothetical protein PR048_022915 [Dryococelus australis]
MTCKTDSVGMFSQVHRINIYMQRLERASKSVSQGPTRLPPRRSGFKSRLGNSGSSHVGIVPDDAVGRRVFSGISHFPTPSFRRCSIPQSPSSALNTPMLRAKMGAWKQFTTFPEYDALATLLHLELIIIDSTEHYAMISRPPVAQSVGAPPIWGGRLWTSDIMRARARECSSLHCITLRPFMDSHTSPTTGYASRIMHVISTSCPELVREAFGSVTIAVRPPRSPNMNTIKHLWDAARRSIRTQGPAPTDSRELWVKVVHDKKIAAFISPGCRIGALLGPPCLIEFDKRGLSHREIVSNVIIGQIQYGGKFPLNTAAVRGQSAYFNTVRSLRFAGFHSRRLHVLGIRVLAASVCRPTAAVAVHTEDGGCHVFRNVGTKCDSDTATIQEQATVSFHAIPLLQTSSSRIGWKTVHQTRHPKFNNKVAESNASNGTNIGLSRPKSSLGYCPSTARPLQRRITERQTAAIVSVGEDSPIILSNMQFPLTRLKEAKTTGRNAGPQQRMHDNTVAHAHWRDDITDTADHTHTHTHRPSITSVVRLLNTADHDPRFPQCLIAKLTLRLSLTAGCTYVASTVARAKS